jgi:alkylated DNA repair protein (DNA oxidative demethylase)
MQHDASAPLTRAVERQVTADLFARPSDPVQELAPGAVLLRAFAASQSDALLAALQDVVGRSPFRHMTTPGGYRMSVAMTNCGECGWITDETGYRYGAVDPATAARWPPLPSVFRALATAAAAAAAFDGFAPDACLISRYEPGARLSLHQDKDELDLASPIVSISLGLTAVFLFGGHRRSDRPLRMRLAHGDVVVWGGPARLRYHGVMALKDGHHPMLGAFRVNLSLRKAR